MTTKAFLAWIGLVGIVVAVMAVVFVTALHRMVTKAEEAARAERDAYWQAEIATSNAKVENLLRLAEMAKAAADDAARATIADVNRKLTDLEKKNEALALGPCGGLGRDRVQLLDFGPR